MLESAMCRGSVYLFYVPGDGVTDCRIRILKA